MSSTLPIITYGGGDILCAFFNAIALSLGEDSFKTLMRLSLLFAGVWAIAESITRRNMLLHIRFIGLTLLVTNILFVPKVSLEIIDRTQTGKVYTVDHVPVGLAIMANITSVIGDGLTQLTEKNFSLPDDVRYSKTGMVMAANLVTAASQFQITDPVFSASLQSYVEQCVFYDLLLHKYAQSDLLNTPNVWAFLKDHSSPARAFLYKDTVTVCQDGIKNLDQDWSSAIEEAATHYGAQMLGVKANIDNSKANLLSYLQTGYGFLTGISDSGAAILQKNLIASSLYESLQHWGARTNATAALESFAFTKAQAQKRLSNQTVGDMAAYWLPLMKTCFEGMLYGAFIFVFLLALFPFGLEVLRNYLAALLWVQLWAPLYAMINLIVSLYAQSKSISLASSGLTLSAIGGLAQVNADMAGLAGYVSLSVPLLAWGLVKGMGSSFVQLAQFVGGAVQSSATATAMETGSGNLSMGNTQLGNHSQFNTNANHWDSNLRYAAGMAMLQTPSGATLSQTPGGVQVLDQRAALSNLGVSIHMSDSLRTAAGTQAQTSYNKALSQSEAASQHYSRALRELSDFGQQQSHSTSSSHGSTFTSSSGLSRVAQDMHQSVESFAKEHHVSHETALQALGQVYGDVHMGVSGWLGASATVGISGSGGLSTRHSRGSLYQEAQRFSEEHHISQSLETAKRAAQEVHYHDTKSTNVHTAHSIASSFEQGDNLRLEAARNFSKAQSLSTFASQTQENAASVDANYNQAFYAWLRKQPAPSGQGSINNQNIETMASHNPAVLQSYADRFVQEKTMEILAPFNAASPLGQGETFYQAASQQFNQSILRPSQVESAHPQFDRMGENQEVLAAERGLIEAPKKSD